MEVKRRLNQFFGNILRKDKVHIEETEGETSLQAQNKKANKSNQSYSQWDLIEHIASEAVVDEPMHTRDPLKDNMIYSDGLAYFTEEALEDLNNAHFEFPLEEGKKEKSFLKRSGSLLRRSLRRSKKKARKEESEREEQKWQGADSDSLSNVVQEINTTLLAVATFGGNGDDVYTENRESTKKSTEQSNAASSARSKQTSYFEQEDKPSLENRMPVEHKFDENEWNEHGGKVGFKNGLKRQASKLASKFHRNAGGSIRLKASVSVESFPIGSRGRSGSFVTGMIIDSPKSDLKEAEVHKRTGSFKRKLSFKQAKKVMRKGASSFGKSMMHASAVMPIAYESPPVTFYPDYEDEYPPHLVQCYYRTVSYQQKECNPWNDKCQHGRCARPTSFYQHGYCYNG